MWQHLEGRGLDPKGTKGFALATASVHYAADRQADVERLRLEIWIDQNEHRIQGNVRVELAPLCATDTLTLDAAELDIKKVSDGQGHPLEFILEDARLEVRLPRRIGAGEPFALTIDYGGEPRRGLYFIGPTEHRPDASFEVWTQGQDDDSRHWFPCFDSPNQKAKTELIAHVPKGMFALSNGELVEQREGEKTSTYHYRHDAPHSTYLMTLVVGQYVPIDAHGGPVPVVSYVHPNQVASGRLTFSRTAEMVRLFADKIGLPYPYPRYAQIVVQDFIFGGMENTTATTLTDQILFDQKAEADLRVQSEALIAHELAHQWWGDLVTCSEWSHAWLNEGFATYFELIWREHAEGPRDAAYGRLLDRELYLSESYRRSLVERTYEEPIDLFDRHQYEKAALVLHLFRFVLGDEGFFRSLKGYAERHQYSTVESHDLKRAFEAATGKNLEPYFDQWVFGAGHPTLTITGAWDDPSRSFNLTIEQTQKGERVAEVFSFPVDVEILTEDGPITTRVEVNQKKQVIRIRSDKRPRAVIFDKGGHIPTQIDNRLPSNMLRAVLAESDDMIAAIEAARTLVSRGDPAAVKAVLDALGNHDFWGVRVECARALKKLPTRNVLDHLMDAILEDGDPRVRRAAIRSLAAFEVEKEEIAEFLIRHTQIERSDYVIADTVRTLAELRADGAKAFLRTSLQRDSHNECIRAAAVEGLGKLRDASVLSLLLERVGPAHHNKLREAAVTAAASVGRHLVPGAVERIELRDVLVSLLRDPWLRVRIRAAEGLKALLETSAIRSLEEQAGRELDGRARRSMRLAERELRKSPPLGDEIDRVRDELKRLEQQNGKLLERVDKLEVQAKRSLPPPELALKKKKKKKKKDR